MQKKSFFKLLLITLWNVVIGNILSLVVTLSLAGILSNYITYGLAAFCSISLFFVFIFNAGFKDGEHERKLVTRKFIEKPEPNKWIIIGIIVWVLLSVPCVLLIFMPMHPYLNIFRFAFASMFALSRLFGQTEIPSWSPFVFMGIYALIPVACRLGHYIGYYEKVTLESIVYKKK